RRSSDPVVARRDPVRDRRAGRGRRHRRPRRDRHRPSADPDPHPGDHRHSCRDRVRVRGNRRCGLGRDRARCEGGLRPACAGATGARYAYHNGLTAPHAASSPWWAWLFDFKPVWFYQEGLSGNTTAAIYDAGNIVAWWLALPALAFAAWQAFVRRSLPLALIT